MQGRNTLAKSEVETIHIHACVYGYRYMRFPRASSTLASPGFLLGRYKMSLPQRRLEQSQHRTKPFVARTTSVLKNSAASGSSWTTSSSANQALVCSGQWNANSRIAIRHEMESANTFNIYIDIYVKIFKYIDM